MDKRELRRQYKEKKTPRGVYVIRCTASGEVWASGSNHLDSVRNSEWFQLRSGGHRNKQLQQAWNAHGEAAFEYEIVETFDDDVSSVLLNDMMRDRAKAWQERLGALAV